MDRPILMLAPLLDPPVRLGLQGQRVLLVLLESLDRTVLLVL
jgi:hypothetical protein